MRTIIGILIGLFVTAAIYLIGKGVAFQSLGVDFVMQSSSFEPTVLSVLAVDLPLLLLAAIFGGFLTTVIAKSSRVALLLAAVVLIGGLGISMLRLGEDEEKEGVQGILEGTPVDQLRIDAAKSQFDVQAYLETAAEHVPVWQIFVVAFIGFFGVLMGARLASGFKNQS